VDYLQKSADLLTGTGFEGNVPFMYRDSNGWVTVGVGFMIPDENAAKKIPFVTALGALATKDQIETDFKRVYSLPAGLVADKYRSQSSLLITFDYTASILLKKLKECDRALRGNYKSYDTYPDPVKLALLDMIYNLGAAKLFGQFPAFNRSVNDQDWKTAADQCHRKHKGAADNRNAWTRHQFLISETRKPIPLLPVHPAHRDAPLMLPQKG